MTFNSPFPNQPDYYSDEQVQQENADSALQNDFENDENYVRLILFN